MYYISYMQLDSFIHIIITEPLQDMKARWKPKRINDISPTICLPLACHQHHKIAGKTKYMYMYLSAKRSKLFPFVFVVVVWILCYLFSLYFCCWMKHKTKLMLKVFIKFPQEMQGKSEWIVCVLATNRHYRMTSITRNGMDLDCSLLYVVCVVDRIWETSWCWGSWGYIG